MSFAFNADVMTPSGAGVLWGFDPDGQAIVWLREAAPGLECSGRIWRGLESRLEDHYHAIQQRAGRVRREVPVPYQAPGQAGGPESA